MEVIINALGTLLVWVFFIFIISYPFYYLFYKAPFFARKQNLTLKQLRFVREVLAENSPYYNNLSTGGKKKFFDRVLTLMNSFDFIRKEGMKITIKVKALICIAIAQATFGWKVFDLNNFYQIQVYPSTFKLSPQLPKMQGASHPKGILVFSWEHLLFGFSVEDDGLNLALHEVAHALKINYFDQASLIPNKRYKYWNEYATKVKLDMELQEENFFERPQEFLKHHPKLYAATCLLLNQNPLNARGDYSIKGKYKFN